MFLVILLGMVIAFVVDLIVAAFAYWIVSNTGLTMLYELDFWNWFCIVILVQVLMWPTVLSSSKD